MVGLIATEINVVETRRTLISLILAPYVSSNLNSLNFDSKKLSVRSMEDHLKHPFDKWDQVHDL